MSCQSAAPVPRPPNGQQGTDQTGLRAGLDRLPAPPHPQTPSRAARWWRPHRPVRGCDGQHRVIFGEAAVWGNGYSYDG